MIQYIRLIILCLLLTSCTHIFQPVTTRVAVANCVDNTIHAINTWHRNYPDAKLFVAIGPLKTSAHAQARLLQRNKYIPLVVDWQNHGNVWPGCDEFNGGKVDIVSADVFQAVYRTGLPMTLILVQTMNGIYQVTK